MHADVYEMQASRQAGMAGRHVGKQGCNHAREQGKHVELKKQAKDK